MTTSDQTLGVQTTNNFNFRFIELSVQMFQPLIIIYIKGLILCIIIGDVHQFIVHCLVPLDP